MKQKTSDILMILGFLAVVAVAVACGVGYVLNIIKLAHMDWFLSGPMVARTLGVLMPPIGAALGLFL